MDNNKLQQQVGEMKVKLAEMEAELAKDSEFKWDYEYGNTYVIKDYFIDSGCLGSSTNLLEHGCYRIHEHNAEQALQLTKETKLIGAIAEQLFPDDTWVADWEDSNQSKYFIYLHDGTYGVDRVLVYKALGTHYMSKEVALVVCDVLNAGKVKL